MPLISMQCKNCGGSLQIDSAAKTYYCPHCHSTFAVEQSIVNEFHTTQIGHIDTQNVIDDGSGKADQAIQNGEALLAFKKYPEANAVFQELTVQYAHKYRTWWGLARAVTENFTKAPAVKSEFLCACDALQNAMQLAAPQEKGEIEQAYQLYHTEWQNYCDQVQRKRSQELDDLARRRAEFEQLIQQKREDNEAEKKMEDERDKKRLAIFGIVYLVVSIVAFIGALVYLKPGITIGRTILCIIGALVFGLVIAYAVVYPLGKFQNYAHEDNIRKLQRAFEKILHERDVGREAFEKEEASIIADTCWLDQ